MGQKVHPIGFRLGNTKSHLSTWFAENQNYSNYLFEDYYLRKKLYQNYESAGFEKIEIFRKTENQLTMMISVEEPTILVGLNAQNLKNFQQEIRQIVQKYRKQHLPLKTPSKIQVTLHIFGCFNMSASSMADFLIEFLEKRYSFRSALNGLLKKKLKKKPPGLKIQISGRLNGAEMARQIWIREGRLPLQTLQAHIDYSSKQAQTIYGLLGVKVWVFHHLHDYH
uniref:Small ribosomal subunit protein uS3c n=1 Tax=Rhipilia penicilloides TaxID=1979422 RepID=A0A2P0QHN2_9CHLO|nr:ribosomal protein S3 [Rhipilia penicilloides]ARO74277.1 ribosomal protein S3 [Rhipilia penicilloides]